MRSKIEEKVEPSKGHVSSKEDSDDDHQESVDETAGSSADKDTPLSHEEPNQEDKQVASSRDIEPLKGPARKAPPPPPRDTGMDNGFVKSIVISFHFLCPYQSPSTVWGSN